MERPLAFPQLELSTENPFAVLVGYLDQQRADRLDEATARLGDRPVEPTGFRWVNDWKREVADPGHPPFLQEPVIATVTWRRKGRVRGFVVDNEGDRIAPAVLEALPGGEGVILKIDGKTPAFHWELTVE